MKMKRRTFVQGCCAGIAAMSGAKLTNLSFAQEATPGAAQPVLLSIFLRGGMDALNFLIPHADSNYNDQRPRLRINTGTALDLDGYFGLHPSAAPLKELFDDQHVGLVCATGIPDADGTRSHFQAQDYMDYGGTQEAGGGWLGRYLNTVPGGGKFADIFRGVSLSSGVSESLGGFTGALSLGELDDFTLSGNGTERRRFRQALRTMYTHDPSLSAPALSTLDAAELIRGNGIEEYAPDVEYPDSGFADALMSVAQLVKRDMGLQAATIDLGGWDTHESQAGGDPTTGSYADNVDRLTRALHAFWDDLGSERGRVTVTVISEFGRRLKENDNRGTDHGHGGMMIVLDTAITEKRVFGDWPGLSNDELYERKDLRVTTDFRDVMGDVLKSKFSLGTGDINALFPGFGYTGGIGFLGLPDPGKSSLTVF